MLVPHGDSHEELGDTLDEHQDETTHHGLLEGDRGATADGEEATSHGTCHDSVQRIILLTVGDEKAVKTGEETTPETKVSSKEGSSVPHVAQAAKQALAFWSVYQTYR